MKKFLLLLGSLYCIFNAHAQNFSNQGKDFWVGYGYHQIMTTSNAQEMVLYFATDQVTTITITIPSSGYTQTLVSGAVPSVLTSNPIPKTGVQDARLLTESVTPDNKGIHIVADKPIVAYAHIYNQSVSGASILFPTNTLGKEYYSINYTNNSNSQNSNCWFYVVAADTGITTVEITPSAATINHAAGVPFTVNLTQGQIYNILGQLTGQSGGPGVFTGVDLTGSKIKSISSGSSGCKKIAVYSGSGRIAISCNGTAPSSDNYMTQAFPKTAWGKKYLTAHTSSLINNIYRICVADPATVVTVDGLPIAVPLQGNFFYEIPATTAELKIEADLPIIVAQYIASQGACGNPPSSSNPGDPEVIYLSPVEQNIAKVLWNATPNFNISQHYFNVIIPNTGTAISSFKLDGVSLSPALFTVHPQDPNYSYLIRSVTAGQHTIESDSGFNAIAYGYGNAESYGYNAGTNIKDLYNFIAPVNPLSISPDPVACTGTPFFLTVTFPFIPESLKFDFHGFQTNVDIPTPAGVTAIFDATYFIGAKQVWRYKLPSMYVYSPANFSPGYPITINAGTTTTEGCGNSFERDFDLAVYDPPAAALVWQHGGCITDSVHFTDNTTYLGGTYSYKWFWDFGDGHIDSVRNPTHIYAVPGIYNVKFAMVSNVGCLSDTARTILTISPLPTATINGTTTVCQNSPSPNITFTPTGFSPFIYTYNINGGSNISSTASNGLTVPVSTATPGTFVYNLVSVKGSTCFQTQSGNATVIVNPLPTAIISGTTSVCQNSISPVITFTGATATAPYKFTYKINGGPAQTVTTTSGNSVTVPVPTNTAGVFTYTLVSVQESSSTTCLQNQAGSATITVNALPTAVISGTTSLCKNAVSPFITFTGANGTAPYTFTYNINGGSNLTVTTTSGNSVTVSAPTTTDGIFTYNLVSVKESSSTTCSQLQSGTAVVTVFPLPTPDFTYSLPSCTNRTITFTDGSAPNAGSLNVWHWNFGDASPVVTTQNPVHTFLAPGTYSVKLYVNTTNGCQSIEITKPVIINPRPKAGFIDPEVCLSDTYAQFNDTSKVAGVLLGAGSSWLWDFDDPSSGALNNSTIQNPQHSYHTIGTKNITLIVTSPSGCKDTLYQSFFVNGDIPVAGLNVLNANGLCANDSVTIENTSTVNVGSVVKIDIYWDNAGAPGTFETDNNPYPNKQYSHIYPNFQNPLTKTYQIRYRAYSGETCINDKIQDIIINAAPKVQFNVIPDTCLNIEAFQITQASEIGGVPGSFVFTGPGVSASGIFDPALVGPGTYMIHYTYTSNKGCMDSGHKAIRILSPPLAKFGFGKPACETKTILFSDSSRTTVGTLTTWTWDFADGTAPVIKNNALPFTHTFALAGTYDVKLVVTTSSGCNSTPTIISVKVNPQPLVDFTFTDTACLPNALIQFRQNASIADNTENTFIYSWNFGDGSLVNHSPNPTHIYTGTGPYMVTLKVQSGANCFEQKVKPVNTIHPQPESGFNISTLSVCIGNSVTFSDISNPLDGGFNAWNWDFGDNNTSTLQNPLHTYSDTGTYRVLHYIINSFGCNSDTLPRFFTVYPYPVVNAGADKVVLEGESVVLLSTATGNDLQYSWTKDINITTNLFLNNPFILSPVCTPVNDMNYTLTVTSRGGCPISDQVKVNVLKIPRIPNTFSPNNDGINDTWEIQYLKTYPAAKVQVFTRTGQLVFESKGYLKAWDGTIKGKPLPVDTYYYIIEPESGRKPVTGYVTIIK